MRPFILAILSAFLFGLSTPLSKGLLAHWTSQQLAGLLYLGAALGVSIPLVISRTGFFPARLDKNNFLRLAGAILFGGILGPLFLLAGLRLASASSVSLWLNLEMVATSVLAVLLFRDHLGFRGWSGAACVLGAGILLSWGEGAAGLRAGAFLGLACICWGMDNNLTALIDGLSPLQSTFWKGLVAGSVNLALGLALARITYSSQAAIFGALGLGAISYGASIVLYIKAAQVLGSSRSQMVFASAPLFGWLGSAVWLREGLSPLQGLAIGLQALGTAFLFKDRHTHAHSHEAMEHVHEHQHQDGHHTHTHAGLTGNSRHTHPHTHEPLSHAHPHWPDLHHRHAHP
jgi:drug/metabolite transporter (DMT)-like permease